MEDISISISLICCKNYRDDALLRAFSGLYGNDRNTALMCYAQICEILLSSGRTLSDYLFFLAVDKNPLLLRFRTERMSALKHDLAVLSAVASIKAEEAVKYLREKFSISDTVDFPTYECGNTGITSESVLAYSECYGNSKFADNKAFNFEDKQLKPVESYDCIRLSDLKNYHTQRTRIIDNTICFINGRKTQNVLLYGDRGTGKSSTVKALVNEYPELRIIQIPKAEILNIYKIYDAVKDNPLKFILFIDDITFSEIDAGYSFLKQVLEGSVAPMPKNCVIYATTNRRHIIKETESERTGDELHAADARDENMSLADRFGLYITFSSPGKNEYLDIVKQIAEDRKLNIDLQKLETLAERFALKKCGRSPRTARQFIDTLESRLELGLDPDIV